MIINIYSIVFLIFTFIAILLAERLSVKVVNIVFKKHLEETSEEERELSEYYEASIIAVIEKDVEAYKGLQEIMNDIYFRIFFRKIMIHSSVFFLVLSPYILFAVYIFADLPLPITTSIFSVAIMYFMSKIIYQTISNYLNMRKMSRSV